MADRYSGDPRRVAACLAACSGIDTRVLERIAANIREDVGFASLTVAEITRERDELLAALRRIRARAELPGAATGTDAVFCFIEAEKALSGNEIDFVTKIDGLESGDK